MSVKPPIEFYFDFASPYAYLASLQIDAVAARHGRAVNWRPILLGVVFKITGATANAIQPLRGNYLRHDVVRCARDLCVPLTMPSVLPLNSVAASRAYYWAEGRDRALARALAGALFLGHWGEGQDLGPSEAVAEVAARVGIDRAELLAGLAEPAVKERLRRETDDAIARGVFGAPFMIVDGEPFWGADRLDQLERWLATGGW